MPADSLVAVEGSRSSAAHGRTLRSVGCALLVAIAYYVGTQIGFSFTPDSRPTSIFWPCNALLLAAFLLAPPRKWWHLHLAVFPVHMFAQLHNGVPLWTASGWFLTNASEGLI